MCSPQCPHIQSPSRHAFCRVPFPPPFGRCPDAPLPAEDPAAAVAAAVPAAPPPPPKPPPPPPPPRRAAAKACNAFATSGGCISSPTPPGGALPWCLASRSRAAARRSTRRAHARRRRSLRCHDGSPAAVAPELRTRSPPKGCAPACSLSRPNPPPPPPRNSAPRHPAGRTNCKREQ